MNQPASREQVIVLLAEDEPIIRAFAEAALEDSGYAVVTAEDGNETLAILDERALQLSGLVTDVRLGAGPDGWDIAHHARERKADIPIVYMTGDSAHDWAAKGVPNSLVLQKPFAAGQLVTALSSLITAVDTGQTG